MSPYPTKVMLGEINKQRGIYAAYFKLNEEQMRMLDVAPLEVFFSPTFLERVTEKSDGTRSFRQFEISGEAACNGLKLMGIKNIGELKKLSFAQVACARGLGPNAMALTLDALQALGIELIDDGKSVDPPPSMKDEAIKLIHALGI